MPDLKYWQGKIQERRKHTPFRDFVKEVASWFNANFYKNNGIVSRFPETDRCGTVYEAEEYRQKFNEGFPGVDVMPDVPFMQQLQKFFVASPKMALLIYDNNENVRYADTVYGAKNSYMTTSVGDICENVLYSIMIFGNCTNVINSVLITSNCENIYHCVNITNSFNIFYCKYVHNCANIWFSSNLIGCAECIFCSGLENQQYCIKNSSYTKEEYYKEKRKILVNKSEYISYFKNLPNEASSRSVKNCSGNGISFSENLENAYFVSRVVNGRNIIGGDGSPLASNLYDMVDISKVDDAYGWMGVGQNSTHMYCGANAATGNNVYYSYFMDTCSYCLGCIGLKNKQFHIFNKEYSKEERFAQVDKIFEKMEADGTLGAFFPANMNPFYFNDTLAYLIDDSFTKAEVTKEGYLRRDEEIRVDVPEGAEIVEVKDLDRYQGFEHGVWKIDPEILKKVIKDEKGNYYRIVKMEYDFLMKYGLPLPTIHRLERIKLGFKFR